MTLRVTGMSKVEKIGLIFAVLFIALAFVSVGIASAATIYVPGNYSTIQEAVDAANARDTIIVRDGNYNENVKVNKRLTIQSENGYTSTTVQAANSGDHVFEITADHVSISGFTIKGANKWPKAGIYFNHVCYCNISENTASNNSIGIRLHSSSNNYITKNNASNNDNGLSLYFSSNYNTLTNNNVSNNKYGIDLWSSSNNEIISCDFEKDGIFPRGESYENEVKNCYVNGKPLVYLENERDKTIIYAGQVILVNSENITINGCNLSDASVGIELLKSSDNVICNNILSHNYYGVYLKHSSNNKIYLNNFINNIAPNVYSHDSVNIWNSSEKITYTYNSKSYINYLGNYWSNYRGLDVDGDGIGDIPYSIKLDADGDGIGDTPYSIDYPLMEPWENYFKPPKLPIHNLNTGKNFSTIQAAIDDPNTESRHIITVDHGTYKENINVNKSLTIKSTSGNPADTIVRAADSSNPVFKVTTNYVNLSGLTVKNPVGYKIPSTPPTLPPIEYIIPITPTPIKAPKEPSCGCNTYPEEVPIENFFELSYEFIRIPTENKSLLPTGEAIEEPFQPEVPFPIKVIIRGEDGISLLEVRNVTITNNIIKNGYHGINISSSINITIADNTITNTRYGLYLVNSNNDTITNNSCLDNADYGIRLYKSTDNGVSKNKCSNNRGGGIYMGSSNNNLITNNNCSNNNFTIHFIDKTTGREEAVQCGDGISVRDSNDNLIYLNNFINNGKNVDSYNSTNIWNSKEKITYTYNGSTYTNYLGNYWDDYEEKYLDAEEIGDIGIWDTPYSINSNKDNYPLTMRFEDYIIANVVIRYAHYDAAGNDHYNLNDEYIVLKNIGGTSINLERWVIKDKENHTYVFPSFELLPGATVTIRTGSGTNTATDLYWGSKRAIWNNKGDTVYLYDANNNLVATKSW